jgi:hypothetical protein
VPDPDKEAGVAGSRNPRTSAGRPRLLRNDLDLRRRGLPDDRQHRAHADPRGREQAVEVVDARHRLRVVPHADVASGADVGLGGVASGVSIDVTGSTV